MSITAQARLQYALDSFSTCTHIDPSRYGGNRRLLTLLLEQLVRKRHVDLLRDSNEDGVYPADTLTQISQTCKHWNRLVNAWLDTKEHIKYGGPLCGYHDPERTKFIIDLNVLEPLEPETTFQKFNGELSKSAIKTWGCLGWSPLTWWFEHVFFTRKFGIEWSKIRHMWRDPVFQMYPKNIRIDMSEFWLSTPVILLDAILTYLGPIRNLNTIEIKVKTARVEQSPALMHAEAGNARFFPLVPILAVIWKWQGLCSPWIARDRSAVSCCNCCHERRPRVLYWDVANLAQKTWAPMNLRDDNVYLDYRLLQWTCDERRYWGYNTSQVENNKRWFDFDERTYGEKATEIDDVCHILGDFLLDIKAIGVETQFEVWEETNAEHDIDANREPQTAEAAKSFSVFVANGDEVAKGLEAEEAVKSVGSADFVRTLVADQATAKSKVQNFLEPTEVTEISTTPEATNDEVMKVVETEEATQRAGSTDTVGTLQSTEDEVMIEPEIDQVLETTEASDGPATILASEDEVTKEADAEKTPETTEPIEILETPKSIQSNSSRRSLRQWRNRSAEAENLPKMLKTSKKVVDLTETQEEPEPRVSRTPRLRRREKESPR